MWGQNMNKRAWLNQLALVTLALVIVLGIRQFVLTPIEIDGKSMEPTFYNGEKLMMEQVSYWFNEPRRFDVIVFEASKSKDYIKRVIGLPGEDIYYQDNNLYINGEREDEPFLTVTGKGHAKTDDFKLEDIDDKNSQIPDDHYLVLGDNRNNSQDSRTIGLIHKEQIKGRAFIRYWPLKKISMIN